MFAQLKSSKHREWRELGENPVLWKNFHLKVLVDMRDGGGQRQNDQDGPDDQDDRDDPIDDWEDWDQNIYGEDYQPFAHLLQVLSLSRLQSLQELRIKMHAEIYTEKLDRFVACINKLPFYPGRAPAQKFASRMVPFGTSVRKYSADLIQLIKDKHPHIKKLGLELTEDGGKKQIPRLAEQLVKFEEVDLSRCDFRLRDGDPDRDFLACLSQLRALLSASATPNSKLKILTFPAVDGCSEVVQEARGRLMVNLVDIEYYEDDTDEDDYDDLPEDFYDNVMLDYFMD